ncbi:MAG: FliM/FliN family flagellar motor switch protein [Gammaproteobacteria bacterium]
MTDEQNEQAASDFSVAQQEGGGLFDPNKLGILNDVSILLTIEIGRAQIKIKDLLNLTKDSVIDLNKIAGEPVDVYANGKLISKGNIITANGKYCVRLTSIPEKTG